MMPFRVSRETLLLSGILLLALAVRLWGVHFGLPYLYHADEPIVVNHALAYGAGDLNPHFFKIPPLVSYLLFSCYGMYFAIGRAAGFFHSARDFEHLFYFDPSAFYLIARLIFGVLLGTLTVYVLYRLVKRFWDSRMALWASFFFAINFLHARDSHYIYTDIPLVLALLMGITVILNPVEGEESKMRSFGSSNLRMTSALRHHLLIGVMIGLTTAIKYNGIFLAIPYLWICFRSVPWKKWPGCWTLTGFAAAATFLVLNPFAVLGHAFFMKELAMQSASNSGGFPWFHHLTYSLAGAMGWPMLILGVLGALWGLSGKDVRFQAVAVFVIGYYAVLCRFGQPYDRYVLPLIPFVIILAAQILLKLRGKSQLLFWILIPFVVLPSILKTVYWDHLMAEPDVRTVAKEWVEKNIPSGSRLALDWGFYMPRLSFSPKQLEEKRVLSQMGFQSETKMRRLDVLLTKPYQPSYELYFLSKDLNAPRFLFAEPVVPFDLGVLKQRGLQYVLLVEALYPAGDPFIRQLQKSADRIKTFSPFRNSQDLTIHDPQTMTGGPFLWKDILPRERNGYPVSIYKIRL